MRKTLCLALLLGSLQNAQSASGHQDQREPQDGVVAGLGNIGQRHGFLFDDGAGGSVAIAGRRILLLDLGAGIVLLMPAAGSHDMVALVYVKLDGNAHGNVHVAGAFSNTNEGLGHIAAAYGLVYVNAFLQILGAFQAEIEVEVFVLAQLEALDDIAAIGIGTDVLEGLAFGIPILFSKQAQVYKLSFCNSSKKLLFQDVAYIRNTFS